jgi:hypothetical protein
MGMANFAYFRDEDHHKIKNLADESFLLGNDCTTESLTFGAPTQDVPEGARAIRMARLMSESHMSGSVYATRPQNTSGSGLLIITSDYLINLHGFSLSLEGLLDAPTILEYLKKRYREEITHARRYLKQQPSLSHLVTKKTLVKAKPGLAEELPLETSPGKRLGHLISFDYDSIDEDQKASGDEAAQKLHEAYHSLLAERETYSPDKAMANIHGGPLHNFTSMEHLASFCEDDIVIAQYKHMCVNSLFFMKRHRRTDANTLGNQISEYKSGSGVPLYIDTHTLMKEFFASQDIKVNL